MRQELRVPLAWEELERIALADLRARRRRSPREVPEATKLKERQALAQSELVGRLGPELAAQIVVRESPHVPPGTALLMPCPAGGHVLVVRHLSDVYSLRGWRRAARWACRALWQPSRRFLRGAVRRWPRGR